MAISSVAIQILARATETSTTGPTSTTNVHSLTTEVFSDKTKVAKVYSKTLTSPTTITFNDLTDTCGDALTLADLKPRLAIVQASENNGVAIAVSGFLAGSLAPGDWVSKYGTQHASLSTALTGTETLVFTGAGDVEVLLLA